MWRDRGHHELARREHNEPRHRLPVRVVRSFMVHGRERGIVTADQIAERRREAERLFTSGIIDWAAWQRLTDWLDAEERRAS